jgi:uncharacterized membrane protein
VITNIDPFGSTFTQALGINNNGTEIVGFETDPVTGFQHGYVDINGVPSIFDPPGSVNTTINGVNDLGQLVGFFIDANDNTIGFVATPPHDNPGAGVSRPPCHWAVGRRGGTSPAQSWLIQEVG